MLANLNCFCVNCNNFLFLLLTFLGGLYFLIEDKVLDDNVAESHFLSLSQTPLTNNIAKFTGGAIFTNSPSAVHVCFNCSTLRIESTPTEISPILRISNITKELAHSVASGFNACPQCWTRNRAESQEGGANVATTATTVKLCKAATGGCVNGDGLLTLLNHTSGEVLEELNIMLFDAFQKPALGQPMIHLEIKTNTADVSLSGQLTIDVSHVTSIADIRMRGPVHSRHNFTLSFVPSILDSMTIEVELRDCMAGETMDADGMGCTSCGADLYNFFPNQSCIACPENAKCSPSTITPMEGFWHSTSKSRQVHDCVVKDACNWQYRARDLEKAAKEAHKNMVALSHDDASYKQCADVSLQ